MQKKRITQILKTFSEKDWRACHKYLKYCNKKEAKTVKVFEYLFRYRSDLNTHKIDQNVIKSKIAPEDSDKAFLNVLSHLTTDIESFLVHQFMVDKEGKYEKTKVLAEIYKGKGLYGLFKSKIATLLKVINQGKEYDIFRDLKSLEVNHLHFFSDIYEKNARPIQILYQADENRNRFSNNLKKYYKLEIINSQTLSHKTYIREGNLTTTKLEELLTALNEITLHEKSDKYEWLENLLINGHDKMSKEIAEATLLHLLNHCLYQIKAGKQGRLINLSNLYQFGLDSGILLFGGKLSETRFLTIIEVISRYGSPQKPEDFIGKWIDKVATKERQSVMNIAFAHWYFSSSDFERAIEKINQVDTKLVNINLSFRSRWLSICSLCIVFPYHEGRFEIIDSAKAFFRRHRKQVGEATYKGSMNLVKLVDLIWAHTDVKIITKFIEECDFLIFRSWANEYIKKMAR